MSEVETPDWVLQVLNGAAECFECMTPIEWRVGPDEDGEWEAEMYPAVVVVDGEEVYTTDVTVDLGPVLEMFDEDPAPAITCTPLGTLIEGRYAGHEFFLRLLWKPPADSEPVAVVDGSEVTTLTEVDAAKPVSN